MADTRRRNQLQHRIEHPESRPQHRHDHHAITDPQTVRRANRCLDPNGDVRDVARRFRRQEQADAHGHVAERLRARRGLPESRQGVVNQRVLNKVHWHAFNIVQSVVGSRQSSVSIVSLSRQSESSGSVVRPSRQSVTTETASCPKRAVADKQPARARASAGRSRGWPPPPRRRPSGYVEVSPERFARRRTRLRRASPKPSEGAGPATN